MSSTIETFLFTPASIPGCRVWYDFSDTRTHTYSSGSNISAVSDKSGNGNSFSGSGTAIAGNIGNGLTTISNASGGTSQPHGISGNSPMVYVFLERFYPGGGLFYRGNTAAGGGNGYTGSYNGSNTHLTGTAQTGINQVGGLINTSGRNIQNKLIISIWNGTNSQLWETGTLLATSGNTTLNQTNATTLFQPANPWEFGEFCIFNTAITTAQRQLLEGYFCWKWNMVSNLSNTHPYYNTRPVVGDPFPTVAIPRSMTEVRLFSPSTLSNLGLWIDTSDSNYMTVSSGLVRTLTDKSNTGKTLTLTFTNLYNITTGTMNGLSTMLFPNDTVDNNSTRSYYVTNSFAYSNTSNTTIAMMRLNPYVLQGTNTQRGWGQIFPIVGSAVQAMQHGISRSGTTWTPVYAQANVGTLAAFNSTILNSGTGPSGPFPVMMTWGRLATNLAQLSYFGTYISTACTANTLASPSAFNIGSFYQNQELCELLYYNRSLTNFEIAQLEGYLGWKWGVQTSLPATHPFRMSPPRIAGVGPKVSTVSTVKYFAPLTLTVPPQVRYSFIAPNFTSPTVVRNIGINTSYGSAAVGAASVDYVNGYITMTAGAANYVSTPVLSNVKTIGWLVYKTGVVSGASYLFDLRPTLQSYSYSQISGTTGFSTFRNTTYIGNPPTADALGTNTWSHFIMTVPTAFNGNVSINSRYTNNEAMGGRLAEIMIWSTALTQAEINSNYNYFADQYGYAKV